MQLQHIQIDRLDISKLNMRHGRKAPAIDDILPSVRRRGILQPLLVRPMPCGERFEIVAGRRRYFAASTVALETDGEYDPLPCAVMEPGDDAAALEASIIENVARLAPDEMSQYEAFAALSAKGRTVEQIAETFAVSERMVERRLALGNLLPGVRTAFRNEEIDAASIRQLTLATKTQQKAWLALFRDPEEHAPRGQALRDWLFGGHSIPVSAALFDPETYTAGIVTDLFGDDDCFADTALFWKMQNEAIVAKREALLDDGWQAVEVLETGRYFATWDYRSADKEEGGKVYIEVGRKGEVTIHEGLITEAEARRRERATTAGEVSVEAAKPETTRSMQEYLDLHRLAAVRLSLIADPGVALRLMLVHALRSSGHWQVRAEPGRSRNKATAESVSTSPAAQLFNGERREVRQLLELEEGDDPVTRPIYEGYSTAELFARLLKLPDDDVLRIAALIMAETLETGSALVEATGCHLGTDPSLHWQADECFFRLIRDRSAMQAILSDIGGKSVADGNAAEKLTTQRKGALDLAEGTNGRQKAEGWLPGWMAFPPKPVTEGGVSDAVSRWARIADLFEE